MDSSEHFTAVATNDNLRKAVIAAVASFLTIGAGLNNSSAHQFFLHSHVYFFWNNGFMVTFNIILWNNAGVLHSSLVKEVSGVGLLQKGIVNGIRSMIGAVKDAVSSVASAIKSFLHFSVPDEGPLTDYESWMPDFMHGLAKGIDKSKSAVERAIDGVASSMNLDGVIPDMTASVNANVSGVDGGSENASVTLNQPIMLDGKTITTLVSQIQYRQGKASLRNLGTV